MSEKSKKKKAKKPVEDAAISVEDVSADDAADSAPLSPSSPTSNTPVMTPLSPEQIAAKLRERTTKGKTVAKAPEAVEDPAYLFFFFFSFAPFLTSLLLHHSKKKKTMAESRTGKISKEQLATLDYSSSVASTDFKVPDHLIDQDFLRKLQSNGGTFQIGDIEYKSKGAHCTFFSVFFSFFFLLIPPSSLQRRPKIPPRWAAWALFLRASLGRRH